MTLKIACLQMNSGPHVAENLDFVEQHLAIAAKAGVHLIQLPENFAQMPRHASEQVVENENQGEIQSFLKRQAALYGITIIAGSLPVRSPDDVDKNPYARCLVVGSEGKEVARYDKIHLFDVALPSGEAYRESDRYHAGSTAAANRVVVPLSRPTMIRLGLSVCYDLRFPELYRELTDKGAELLSVPSAFTFDTGKAHWETLLRTRAIENQAFVFAAAQTGQHANGRTTWGHSMIIDPWGKILEQSNDQPGLIMATIDPIKLHDLREQFPALKNRRI